MADFYYVVYEETPEQFPVCIEFFRSKREWENFLETVDGTIHLTGEWDLEDMK